MVYRKLMTLIAFCLNTNDRFDPFDLFLETLDHGYYLSYTFSANLKLLFYHKFVGKQQ